MGGGRSPPPPSGWRAWTYRTVTAREPAAPLYVATMRAVQPTSARARPVLSMLTIEGLVHAQVGAGGVETQDGEQQRRSRRHLDVPHARTRRDMPPPPLGGAPGTPRPGGSAAP